MSRISPPNEIDGVMLRLRAKGMPYPWISVVLAEYHGYRLSPDNVRHRCRTLGAPPMRVRSEQMRRHWQRKKQAETAA